MLNLLLIIQKPNQSHSIRDLPQTTERNSRIQQVKIPFIFPSVSIKIQIILYSEDFNINCQIASEIATVFCFLFFMLINFI